MRKLTLDEKISLKGIFAYKGMHIPKLNMELAVALWGWACGYRITRWHLFKGR